MSSVVEMISNLAFNELCERRSIMVSEAFETLELEIQHMIGVEMFQRVLVHRLSRVAFRRLKRRARKSRASMARAAGRVPPLKINGMLAEDNDDSESESDIDIPKIEIRKVKKNSISGESACHSDTSARSSNSAMRQVHSPYTYKGYCSTTQDATGAFVPDDSLTIGQHLTPEWDCEDCTDNEFTSSQNDSATSPRTCDHHQSWKRLRHKRGISYFVCTTCNRRWRKMNANAAKELECQPSFPQQMFTVPMPMPVPMYACAYPFACYYPAYTQ